MNAPIADQIKAEAAKSLLERMAEKTKLVRFFRYNASAKHGVPIDNDDVSINISAPEKTTTAAPEVTKQPLTTPKPETPSSQTIVQPVVIEKTNGSGDKMKGILQTLAAVGALGAAVWGGSKLASTSPSPEPPKAPEKIVVQPYQESPFQYLEDMGEHLP